MHRSLLILLCWALAGAGAAEACSCAGLTPEEAYTHADRVFVGEVVSIEQQPRPVSFPDPYHLVTFRVEFAYKGTGIRKAVVDPGSGTCYLPFEPGERYLVYAHQAEGYLRAGLCSRSAPIDQAWSDVAAFSGADGGLCGGPTNAAAMQVVVFTLLGLAVMRRRSVG